MAAHFEGDELTVRTSHRRGLGRVSPYGSPRGWFAGAADLAPVQHPVEQIVVWLASKEFLVIGGDIRIQGKMVPEAG